MADVYNTVSIVCFILSGIALIISLFLFFKLKIRTVIGELTGKTAKKQIEEIRNYNQNRKKRSNLLFENRETKTIEDVSQQWEKTEVLQEEDTTVLCLDNMNVSRELEEGTVILQNNLIVAKDYKILDDILEIHTQKVIGEYL